MEKIETLITGKLRSASALPQQQTEEKAALHPVAASRKVHKEDESGGSRLQRRKRLHCRNRRPLLIRMIGDRSLRAAVIFFTGEVFSVEEDSSKKTMTSPSEKTTPTAYWDEILAVVRERKRTVEALLREGSPGRVRREIHY